MTQTATDIWHFQSLDAIVGDVGYEFHVVDVELSFALAVGIHLAEEFYLILVEMLPHLLHHPDVAKEGGSQITVSHHGFLYHAQMGVYQFDDLVLRPDIPRRHLVKLVRQALQLSLYHGIIDVFLAAEIGIQRAAPLA